MDELWAAHHLVWILLESISPLNIRDFILSVGSRVFERSRNRSTVIWCVVYSRLGVDSIPLEGDRLLSSTRRAPGRVGDGTGGRPTLSKVWKEPGGEETHCSEDSVVSRARSHPCEPGFRTFRNLP